MKTPRLAEEVGSEAGASIHAPMVAVAKMGLETWALNSATSPAETNRMKEMMETFEEECRQLERERGHRAGPEPGARGEIYWRDDANRTEAHRSSDDQGH